MAPPRWRGPNPRSTTSFKYSSRRLISTDRCVILAGDNMVSDDLGSPLVAMNSQSSTCLGSTIDDILNAIMQRLDAIERRLNTLVVEVVHLDLQGGGGKGDTATG
ncbi:hypothetical protein GUJ93_ZPchr0005g15543 [Zizania palustris]|uniref:Uncharacterized protein n=1 Tax=Zizania palustris TaxID=103762 RepID=A0A8J5W216_ZIZPA|nr:hypothetical protein GUJ93_ZPchr0005g15543 [Zizania palustris]